MSKHEEFTSSPDLKEKALVDPTRRATRFSRYRHPWCLLDRENARLINVAEATSVQCTRVSTRENLAHEAFGPK